MPEIKCFQLTESVLPAIITFSEILQLFVPFNNGFTRLYNC